jgi:hypothetical protein
VDRRCQQNEDAREPEDRIDWFLHILKTRKSLKTRQKTSRIKYRLFPNSVAAVLRHRHAPPPRRTHRLKLSTD